MSSVSASLASAAVKIEPIVENVRMESNAVGPIAWMRLEPRKLYTITGMEQPYSLQNVPKRQRRRATAWVTDLAGLSAAWPAMAPLLRKTCGHFRPLTPSAASLPLENNDPAVQEHGHTRSDNGTGLDGLQQEGSYTLRGGAGEHTRQSPELEAPSAYPLIGDSPASSAYAIDCGTAKHVIVMALRMSHRRFSFQLAAYSGSHCSGGKCCFHDGARRCPTSLPWLCTCCCTNCVTRRTGATASKR